jgi:hypothetical protein
VHSGFIQSEELLD